MSLSIDRASVHFVIPAAGEGKRLRAFTGKVPKALASLFDESSSLLELTLRSVQRASFVSGITVVCRSSDIDMVTVAASKISIPVQVVTGGATRQDSVFNGLVAIPKDVQCVAVHDAARPFCPLKCMRAVCETALRTRAALLAVPVSSTLKHVIDGHTVDRTVDRKGLWLAQTPQVFDPGLIKEAFAHAKAEGYVGTDECSLVERLRSVPVSIVCGVAQNIKITSPEDIALACAIWAMQ